MKTILLWVSAIAGLIATVLWFMATFVQVDYKRTLKKDGTAEPAITEDENGGREIDVLLTAKRQTRWNRWAALATGISMLAQAISLICCGANNAYECIERTEKEVPNFQATGTHTEVDYVLLHDGHKIYATCEVINIGNLDPTARCGFRPLRTYKCEVQPAGIEKQAFPLSDLKCKDGDGHNVYLYVYKKE